MEFVLCVILVVAVWLYVSAKGARKVKKYAPNVHRHLYPTANQRSHNCNCSNNPRNGSN